MWTCGVWGGMGSFRSPSRPGDGSVALMKGGGFSGAGLCGCQCGGCCGGQGRQREEVGLTGRNELPRWSVGEFEDEEGGALLPLLSFERIATNLSQCSHQRQAAARCYSNDSNRSPAQIGRPVRTARLGDQWQRTRRCFAPSHSGIGSACSSGALSMELAVARITAPRFLLRMEHQASPRVFESGRALPALPLEPAHCPV